jgi:hypothetical protein
MGSVFGIVGAVAGVFYRIHFDPFRAPATTAWSIGELEILALYAIAGFVVGWIVGVLFSKVGREE